jgi:hypothetical protein
VFYSWSRGLVPATRSNALPIYNALADDFRVVLTSGRIMGKDEYWERLVGLHGTRKDSPRSAIANVSLRPLSDDHLLAVFDLVKDGREKKVDSAILRSSPQSSTGIVWVYVHESCHELQLE